MTQKTNDGEARNFSILHGEYKHLVIIPMLESKVVHRSVNPIHLNIAIYTEFFY